MAWKSSVQMTSLGNHRSVPEDCFLRSTLRLQMWVRRSRIRYRRFAHRESWPRSGPPVPKPTSATRRAGARSREVGTGLASNACSGGASWAKCSRKSKLIFIIRGACCSAKRKANGIMRETGKGLPANASPGGMSGRISIKVGTIIAIPPQPRETPSCEESQSGTFTNGASRLFHAGSATVRPTPGYGRRMDDGAMFARVTATASVLTLLVLMFLLGAGLGISPRQRPAEQTPAAPAACATSACGTTTCHTDSPLPGKPDTGQEPSDEVSSSLAAEEASRL